MFITCGPKDANGYYTVTGKESQGGEVFTYYMHQVADRDSAESVAINLRDQHLAAMAARDPSEVQESRVTALQAAADMLNNP
jgi:hypothetical protein